MDNLLFDLIRSARSARCAIGLQRIKSLIPILFATLFLAACGGGSGGGASVPTVGSDIPTDPATSTVSSANIDLLPAAEKVTGGALTLGYDNSKTKWAQVNIYIFDGADLKPEVAGSFPGSMMNKTEDANGLWTYIVVAKYLRNGAVKVIFNNAAGAQTPDLSISASANYIDGSWVTVTESESWVFRGSPNNWGKTQMLKSGNVFTTCQKFSESESAFKISNNNKNDWEESYPSQNYSVNQYAS